MIGFSKSVDPFESLKIEKEEEILKGILTGYKDRGLFQTTAFKKYPCPYYVFFVKNKNNWDIIFKSKDKKDREWHYCPHGDYTITYNVDDNHKAYLSLKYNESKIQRVRKDKLYNSKHILTIFGIFISRIKNYVLNAKGINNLGYCVKAILGHRRLLHRLVAHAFCSRPEHLKDVSYEDLVVNHIDGNKANNHYSNLEWCTNLENMEHSYNVLLNKNLGDDNVTSKLTDIEVKEIREHYLINPGTMYKYYADKYKVSVSCIHLVIINKSRIDKNYIPIITKDFNFKIGYDNANWIRQHKHNNPNTSTSYYSKKYNCSEDTIYRIFKNTLYKQKT
jgi:hypothetical protein